MNLLPQQKKDGIRKEVFLKFAIVVFVLILFWSGVVLALIFNSFLYINAQIPAIEERIAVEQGSASTQAYEGLEEQISNLNSILAEVDKISDRGSIDPAGVLHKISSVIAGGVVLTNLSYREDVLVIGGHADLREQVLLLKKTLENDSLCSRVTSAEITQEFDVGFNFTCSLLKK